ncbi:NUDIX hydrolase [Candidatus Bathyarchaeota archaeon]|nr:NUDIX hydrolase [Candidatus Bathyarchaeota archaeon]
MNVKRTYPEMPLVGVGAVIQLNDQILLIRRANDPGKGLWSIPGGLVEAGETLREAAKREVEEETGVAVEIGDLLDVIENIVRDESGRVKFHYILVDFKAKPLSESIDITPSSEALEAGWFTPEEIRKLPLTQTARKLLRKIGIEI